MSQVMNQVNQIDADESWRNDNADNAGFRNIDARMNNLEAQLRDLANRVYRHERELCQFSAQVAKFAGV